MFQIQDYNTIPTICGFAVMWPSVSGCGTKSWVFDRIEGEFSFPQVWKCCFCYQGTEVRFTNYVAKIAFWHPRIWNLDIARYLVYCYRVYVFKLTLSGFFFFLIMLNILCTVSLLTVGYHGRNKNYYSVLGPEEDKQKTPLSYSKILKYSVNCVQCRD